MDIKNISLSSLSPLQKELLIIQLEELEGKENLTFKDVENYKKNLFPIKPLSIRDIKELDSLSVEQKSFLTNQLHEITDKPITFNDVKLYKEITSTLDKKEYARLANEVNSLSLYQYFYHLYGFNSYPLINDNPQFEEEIKSWNEIENKFRIFVNSGNILKLQELEQKMSKPLFWSFLRSANERIRPIGYDDIILWKLSKNGYLTDNFVLLATPKYIPDFSIFEFLVKNGYKINNTDENGRNLFNTLIGMAIYLHRMSLPFDRENYMNIVTYLIENGVNIDQSTLYWITISLDKTSIPIFKMLLERGLNIEQKFPDGKNIIDIIEDRLKEYKEGEIYNILFQKLQAIDEYQKKKELTNEILSEKMIPPLTKLTKEYLY